MPPLRAIGIVRVSRSAGRSGESFSSPHDQADRIKDLAIAQGWDLIIPEPHEIDVSGDALLVDRPQLSRAVEAVQEGRAEIIAAAHTERLWWNHETASQVIRLVEAASGEVWSADQGLLTRRSAADEFSGTVRTAADRLSRRQNMEKSAAAVQRAIDRGVVPWPRVTHGYIKREDGRYEPDPRLAPVIREVFERRAGGALVRELRVFLANQGVLLTYPAIVKLLKQRAVLGEVHFGKYQPNLRAHDPIVPRDVWATVQGISPTRGRLTKSERLLARVGVLRCGTCNSKLVTTVVIGAGGGRYPIYRCQNHDCSRHVTISAPRAEEIVSDAVRSHLADLEGTASAEGNVNEAAERLERAQGGLEAAIRTLSIVGEEPAAVARLVALKAERDEARGEHERLRGIAKARSVDTAGHWDDLSLEERRALIRATVERALVAPGRGAGRVTVEFFSE